MKAWTNYFLPYRSPGWILLPLLLLLTNVVAGFNGLYGQDSFEYLRYSRELHHFLRDGILPGHFYWPKLYPLAGALFAFLLPDIMALQIVSLISFALTIYYLRKILIYIYPEKENETGLYLFLFYSLSPFVLRYASVVMSESLCIFFIVAFLYHYLIFRETAEKKHIVFLLFFASAAVNTRYPSAMIIMIPLADALIRFFRKFNPVYFFLSLFAALLLFLPDIILKASGSSAFNGPFNVPAWSFFNFFHHRFDSIDGFQSYTFPNICYVFSNLIYPGYIFIGLLFLFLLKRKEIMKPFTFIPMVIYILYALFIAGFPFQNDRILLLSFPMVIILFCAPFFRSWSFIIMKFRKLSGYVIVIIFLVQAGLFYRAYLPFYKGSREIREIATRMKAYPDKTIYTFNIDQGLKAYEVKNEIISLWSDSIGYFKPGSLVLFNYKNTASQWENKNPMINWDKLNRDSSLVLLENLPGNWSLYEIKN